MKLYLLSSLFLTASYLQNNAVFAQLSDGALQQPSVLSQSTSGDFTIDLSLAEGQHETVAATTFNTRLLGGTLPGPTIRVKKGEWLYVNFSNDLVAQPGSNTAPNEYNYPDSTNLHFHGGHVSGERPGDDTSLIIDAGTSYQYKVFFPQFHMGGTHWIHPHRHGSGTLQVAGGAAQLLIVDDSPFEVPPEVELAEEVLMMVQLFDTDTMDTVTSDSGDGLFNLVPDGQVGAEFTLINGQFRPTLEIVAGEWQRWRIAFGSWDRNPLDLQMVTNGICEMNLLAKDGIYITDYPRPLTLYPISTAGRADIMVRCSQTGSFTVNDYLGELFTLNSVAPSNGAAIDVSTPATSNYAFPRPSYLNNLQNTAPTDGCACETILSRNQLNGISYQSGLYLHTIAQGSVVERTLQGVSSHPYHQHVYPFELQQFFGINEADAAYHKVGDYHDTLMLRSSNTVRIKYEANNFLGRMAVHCHRLTHSDRGMILAEDVLDPSLGGVCSCSPTSNGDGFTRPPVEGPTLAPVSTPAPIPTEVPESGVPTATPTEVPESGAPTETPTESRNVASGSPTDSPTRSSAAPTDSPISPTDSPTRSSAAPTDSPISPTDSPTPATVDCEDSPFDLMVSKQPRSCEWVRDNNKCGKQKFWSHCLGTCNKCDVSCRDSKAQFKIQLPNQSRPKNKKCSYFRKNQQFCSVPGVDITCPKACGAC